MLFDHPFTTYLGTETDPEFNGSDAEVQEYILRENLIHQFLTGEEGEAVILDCLNEQGINPHAYLNSVEFNIELIISNRVEVTDAGLWVPQY
jgi:hypothetical protein